MENVRQSAEEVLFTLEEELGLLGDLLGLAREKTRLLSHADAEGLKGLLAQEEETVASLREKEAAREKRAKRLARAVGIPDGRATLRALAEGTPDADCARRLTDAGGRMLRTVRELTRQSEKARRLLRHQVRYTDFMLGVLSRPEKSAHFYNMQGGREEESGFFSRLDYHA